jgi:hypothetical protein
MEYLLVFGLMFVIIAFICWRWVEGIDYMKKNHPDYNGDDFLNWGEDDFTKSAGRDVWDDEWNAHTEGEF